MRSAAIAIAALLALAGCSGQPDQPGGLTADETQQLNQAAAMLDANSVSADAVGADEGSSNRLSREGGNPESPDQRQEP